MCVCVYYTNRTRENTFQNVYLSGSSTHAKLEPPTCVCVCVCGVCVCACVCAHVEHIAKRRPFATLRQPHTSNLYRTTLPHNRHCTTTTTLLAHITTIVPSHSMTTACPPTTTLLAHITTTVPSLPLYYSIFTTRNTLRSLIAGVSVFPSGHVKRKAARDPRYSPSPTHPFGL